MKPTVGRIVHFYTGHKSEQSNNRGTGPYAAIIVGLCGNSDDPNQMLNLNVFADHAPDFTVGSVLGFNTPGADATQIENAHYWQWPPREESGSTVAEHYADPLLDADAPTGLEGKTTPLVQIPLTDAKAFRDYFDGIKVPDELVEPVKYLHWAITDREG